MQEEKRCILLIDDTPAQLYTLIYMLQPKYKTMVAKDGKTGIQFAAEHDINLILLDIVMPDMSGIEVLEILKADDKTRHIPIVMATGDTTAEEIKKCFYLGASDYIIKPFEYDKVFQCITKLLK